MTGRRPMIKWLVVGVMVFLSVLGVPTLISRFSTDRTKEESLPELVVGLTERDSGA